MPSSLFEELGKEVGCKFRVRCKVLESKIKKLLI